MATPSEIKLLLAIATTSPSGSVIDWTTVGASLNCTKRAAAERWRAFKLKLPLPAGKVTTEGQVKLLLAIVGAMMQVQVSGSGVDWEVVGRELGCNKRAAAERWRAFRVKKGMGGGDGDGDVITAATAVGKKGGKKGGKKLAAVPKTETATATATAKGGAAGAQKSTTRKRKAESDTDSLKLLPETGSAKLERQALEREELAHELDRYEIAGGGIDAHAHAHTQTDDDEDYEDDNSDVFFEADDGAGTGTGGYDGYDGHEAANEARNEARYQAAYEAGYDAGHDAGNRAGRWAGYEDGYREGSRTVIDAELHAAIERRAERERRAR